MIALKDPHVFVDHLHYSPHVFWSRAELLFDHLVKLLAFAIDPSLKVDGETGALST